MWLQFDNSYFQRICDPSTSTDSTSDSMYTGESSRSNTPTSPPPPSGAGAVDSSQLLWLPTDQALYDCPEYRPYFVQYGRDQEAFFRDFSAAYVKMSLLGARFQYRVRVDACCEQPLT